MMTRPSQSDDPRDTPRHSEHNPDRTDDGNNNRDKPSLFDLVTNPDEFSNWQRERREEEQNGNPDR